MEDNNNEIWIQKPKEDWIWVEENGFRMLVSKPTSKQLESIDTPSPYKFAPMPKIVGDFWIYDSRLRTKLGRSVVKKFKKMRNR